MSKTLHFDVEIRAPRATVWDTMLAPEGYRAWTAAFCEGSYYTGSWEQGAAIRFLTPQGEGMVSEIAENRPHEYLSIRHLGAIARDGTEDTTSEQVRAWAPSYENYAFEDVPGGTRVRVSVDTLPGYEQFMNDTFPRALARLKELCEQGAGATGRPHG